MTDNNDDHGLTFPLDEWITIENNFGTYQGVDSYRYYTAWA